MKSIGLLLAIPFLWVSPAAADGDGGSKRVSTTGDYSNRRAAEDLVDDGSNDVCDSIGGCFTSLSDGRIRDNVGGRAVYHAVLDTSFTGEQGDCPDGFFEFLGSSVFPLPDGSVVNGSSSFMYLRGGAIHNLIVNTKGCFNLSTFLGFGTQGVVAVGGTGRFEGISGEQECKFDAVGLPGQFAGPFECHGELTFPKRNDD